MSSGQQLGQTLVDRIGIAEGENNNNNHHHRQSNSNGQAVHENRCSSSSSEIMSLGARNNEVAVAVRGDVEAPVEGNGNARARSNKRFLMGVAGFVGLAMLVGAISGIAGGSSSSSSSSAGDVGAGDREGVVNELAERTPSLDDCSVPCFEMSDDPAECVSYEACYLNEDLECEMRWECDCHDMPMDVASCMDLVDETQCLSFGGCDWVYEEGICSIAHGCSFATAAPTMNPTAAPTLDCRIDGICKILNQEDDCRDSPGCSWDVDEEKCYVREGCECFDKADGSCELYGPISCEFWGECMWDGEEEACMIKPECNLTMAPTPSPTGQTGVPSQAPTDWETKSPTPSESFAPSKSPSSAPTSLTNSGAPTSSPQVGGSPSLPPALQPTGSPTLAPTNNPTAAPTKSPTLWPSATPSVSPTSKSKWI